MATWLSMSELQDAVTRNIRHVMVDFGLDQEGIAAVLGISAGALSNKMSGKRPWKFEDISKLAGHFRVSEMEFVRERRLSMVGPAMAATGTDNWTGEPHSEKSADRTETEYPVSHPDALVLRLPHVRPPAQPNNGPGRVLPLARRNRRKAPTRSPYDGRVNHAY